MTGLMRFTQTCLEAYDLMLLCCAHVLLTLPQSLYPSQQLGSPPGHVNTKSSFIPSHLCMKTKHLHSLVKYQHLCPTLKPPKTGKRAQAAWRAHPHPHPKVLCSFSSSAKLGQDKNSIIMEKISDCCVLSWFLTHHKVLMLFLALSFCCGGLLNVCLKRCLSVLSL